MKLLVISGGNHPYEESTPILKRFLGKNGHDVTVDWDTDVLSDTEQLNQYDALVFNTLRINETTLKDDQQAGKGSNVQVYPEQGANVRSTPIG